MLSSPAVTAALAGSDIAYVVVRSASGPMVTPLLFTAKDGRLWMVMPSSSAKVTAIGHDPRVGVTVRGPAGTAVFQGEARLVDPRHPQSVLGALPEALLSPRAVGSYLADNLRHLAGMVGPAALAPRTLAAVRPARGLVVDDGGTIAFDDGWSGTVPAPAAAPASATDEREPDVDLTEVPAALAAATDREGPVIVGWTTPDGPVGLPATWDPDRQVATLATGLFERTGCLPTSRACVLFDTTVGTKLEDKAGVVLRGAGRATPSAVAGDGTDVTVDTERVSWWRGAESHSVKTP